jgi:hypothetical protein
LKSIGGVFETLTNTQQKRVLAVVESSGQLPVSRDVPSYAEVCSLLYTIYVVEPEGAESKAGTCCSLLLLFVGTRPTKHISPETKAEAKQAKSSSSKIPSEDKHDAKAAAKTDSPFRLLGDLPSLPGHGQRQQSNRSESSKVSQSPIQLC